MEAGAHAIEDEISEENLDDIHGLVRLLFARIELQQNALRC